MEQKLILVTGHICAGKSVLYEHLKQKIEIQKVDLADIHKLDVNLFRTSEKFNNYEPRLYYLIQQIINQLFNQQSVYIEVLGIEPWFQIFRNTLKKLWVPLIQIELKRSSIELAIKCLNKRCSLIENEDDRLAIYQAEYQGLQETYYNTWNLEAKKIIINQNFEGIIQLIEQCK